MRGMESSIAVGSGCSTSRKDLQTLRICSLRLSLKIPPYDTTKRAAVSASGFVDGNEAFYMVTPDLRPINGVVLFQNQLVISTESKVFTS